MNFLMDFSKLFLEKHGQEIYDEIGNKIKKEAPSKYNDEYVQIIFKVALLNYWEISDSKIREFLKNKNDIDIKNIKNIHKHSIQEIQNYIKVASNNEK